MNTDNAKAQMRKGVLEYCILSILSEQDYYATDIINKLKDSKMIVVEGTLYPLLTRQKMPDYNVSLGRILAGSTQKVLHINRNRQDFSK